MNIDCYFIGFNESETIHLTIRHYKAFCRNVFYYDNFSTDNTRDIAEREGAIVKLFGIEGQLNDQEYTKLKNNCWKGSDADWVIVCDADEILTFIYHDYCTIVRTQGYNMFSETVPGETWLEINTGIPDNNYSKLICFNPKAIKEIGYVYGCHEAKPTGEVKFSTHTANLLHYKHVGGAERLVKRHALYASRLSAINKKWALGSQYAEPPEKTRKYFYDNLALAKPIF
jgi:glycosyltransferase involved in cell wall biosynthesis